MNENIIIEASAHAAECYPAESVGLVVQTGRKAKYVRVKNIHPNPLQHFQIAAADMECARQYGDIIRIIHSHPDCAGAVISDADEATMNEIEIPFGILNYPFTEYNEFHPFATPLIGRPFVLGSQDCYGLIMDWHKQFDIHLTDFRLPYAWWESDDVNLYVDNFRDVGFELVDEWTPGDMVVMTIQASKPNHAGILLPNGDMLHHLYGQLSCRDFFGAYFRERVATIEGRPFVVRHRDLPSAQDIKQWL